MDDFPKWRVVWVATGETVTPAELDEYVRREQKEARAAGHTNHLHHWSLGLGHRTDGFAIDESGYLLIMDSCGSVVGAPAGVFRVEVRRG